MERVRDGHPWQELLKRLLQLRVRAGLHERQAILRCSSAMTPRAAHVRWVLRGPHGYGDFGFVCGYDGSNTPFGVSLPGNEWTDNTFDDGAVVDAAS